MMHARKMAGDTIVEVLIAMAVASAVIGGAYAVANRTLANARQAQEHSEALKIAQTQVERIRANYDDAATKAKLESGTDACFQGNAIQTGSCDSGGTVNFTSVIKKIDPGVFRVQVTWPNATGTGTDSIAQTYKVMQ